MAGTLADLKARIIAETNRDDLADDLATVLANTINRAIEFYADNPFWFNRARDTSVSTVAGAEYVARPTGLRSFETLLIGIGGAEHTLSRRDFAELERLAAPVTTGQPYRYAEFGAQIRLYPKPNAAYPLTFIGLADLPALIADTSTNAWTDTAQDLIAARVRFLLYRDVFRNTEAAASAMQAEEEALQKLRADTARRVGSGRIRAWG